MLSRLKAAEPVKDVAYFRRALKLPLPTIELTAAEKASREAAANLRDVVGRRESMRVEAGVENPTKTIQPTEITRRKLADLETKIVAARAADSEARTEFERQKTIYRDQVRDSLAGDIDGLGKAILNHFDQALALLDVAAALGVEAREARVEVPGLARDAAIAKQMVESAAVNTIRKMVKGTRA